jgi:hypothetical protein
MNADDYRAICHARTRSVPGIPTQAGIDTCTATRLDSRMRGNDDARVLLPNCVHATARLRYLRLPAVALVLVLTGMAHAQRQAQLPWWDRAPAQQIGAYWIKSDLPAEQVKAIGQHLNLMHREFNAALASVPVRVQEKLDVYVFANRDEWALTVRTQFALNPPERGGFMISPSDYSLAFFTEGLSAREIDQIIQREGFRQFAHNRFERDLPLWLNEGLADLFGEAVLIDEMLLFGQSTPHMLEAIQAAVAADKHIRFDVMLNLSAEEWAAQQKATPGEFIWHQSRLMSLFVMQAPQALAIYLRHLNSGLPHDHAFVRAFGMDAAAMEQHWKQFALSAQPGAFATALERIEFLAHGMLELHKRNITPDSINTMRKALREIDFSLELKTLHGTHRISAADDAPFQIPRDALCLQQPMFILSKSRPIGPLRQRQIEQANPAPPTIATQHLRPSQLRIQWVRDDKGGLIHQVTVR